MSELDEVGNERDRLPQAVRMKPREYRRQVTGEWRKEIAFQWWFAMGGPAVPLTQVAAHFGLTRDTVRGWHEREGWLVKYGAIVRDAGERSSNGHEYLVSSAIGREEISRAMVGLWLNMTFVIRGDGNPGGGLRPTLAPNQKPAVPFRVADYIEVTRRIEAAIEREIASGRVAGKVGSRFIPREDLAVLAALPAESLARMQAVTGEIIERLRADGLVRAQGPDSAVDGVPGPDEMTADGVQQEMSEDESIGPAMERDGLNDAGLAEGQP